MQQPCELQFSPGPRREKRATAAFADERHPSLHPDRPRGASRREETMNDEHALRSVDRVVHPKVPARWTLHRELSNESESASGVACGSGCFAFRSLPRDRCATDRSRKHIRPV